jgi:DASH complex subunit DAD3
MLIPTQIAGLAKLTSESPNESLLAELRELEKKMGLVLTLVSAWDDLPARAALINLQFTASVWAVLMEHRQAAEDEEARAREQQAAADVSYDDRDWSEDSML